MPSAPPWSASNRACCGAHECRTASATAATLWVLCGIVGRQAGGPPPPDAIHSVESDAGVKPTHVGEGVPGPAAALLLLPQLAASERCCQDVVGVLAGPAACPTASLASAAWKAQAKRQDRKFQSQWVEAGKGRTAGQEAQRRHSTAGSLADVQHGRQ